MRRELRKLELLSQNAQGLNDDKFEELLAFMRRSGCFAFAVQETWGKGRASECRAQSSHLVLHAADNGKLDELIGREDIHTQTSWSPASTSSQVKCITRP